MSTRLMAQELCSKLPVDPLQNWGTYYMRNWFCINVVNQKSK